MGRTSFGIVQSLLAFSQSFLSSEPGLAGWFPALLLFWGGAEPPFISRHFGRSRRLRSHARYITKHLKCKTRLLRLVCGLAALQVLSRVPLARAAKAATAPAYQLGAWVCVDRSSQLALTVEVTAGK